MQATMNRPKPTRRLARLLRVSAVALMVNLSAPASAFAAGQSIDGGATVEVPSPEQGSPWTVGGALYIGNTSTGTLNIGAGGVVESDGGIIGSETGATGTVTVAGEGARWKNTFILGVGASGTGTLDIGAGGVVESYGGIIGSETGATGTVTVAGEGARWESVGRTVYVGSLGTGTLNIGAGGVVTSFEGYVGREAGGTGAATVAGEGARWENTYGLVVGDAGTGTLDIGAGGVVESDGGYIGVFTGGTGTVTVRGAGARWENTARLYVGDEGTGTLNIGAGGVVQNTSGIIGSETGATGTATVAGAGSRWKNDSFLRVGSWGTGTLNIGAGGVVESDGGYIGVFTGGTGTVTVAGEGARWENAGELVFGPEGGTGTLDIGAGGVVKNTTGYIGSNASATGIVTVAGAGARWENDGDLFLGNSGTGTLNLLEGGTVTIGDGAGNPGTVHVANEAGSTGTLNIGAKTQQTARAAGTLTAAALVFGDGDGTLVFNHTGTLDGSSLVFAPSISGQGKILHEHGTTVLSGDSAAFLGATTITGGTLSVGGSAGTGTLGGTLTVVNGGTLAGSGTVGATTVAAGGTLAPGNALGTLAIDGDLSFERGSRYHVAVEPDGTRSDRIDAAGTVSIQGGSVLHLGAGGQYQPKASYRILTAGTGLSGAFDAVASNFVFLSPALAYDYDRYTVDLTLERNHTSFASQAHTPNQLATAQALETLPESSALLGRLLTLPHGAPAPAFDALSGEAHASVAAALHLSSATARSLPLSHLRNNLAADLRSGAARPPSATLPLWTEVVGRWQHLGSDGNAARLTQTTGGLFVGGDQAVGQGWRLGAALGYTDSHLRVADRDSTAKVSTYSATLYGGKAFELGRGKLNLLLGGAYSGHDIKTTRHTAVADWHHTLKAKYRAHTRQVFGELGYALPLGRLTLEPFAGVAWSTQRRHGFSEAGGPTALSAQRDSDSLTTSTLGLRASTAFEHGTAQGRVHGALGWRHAFGRLAPERTLAFEGSQPFTVAAPPLARHSALVELGVDLALSPTARVGVTYNGQLGGGQREQAANVTVQWRF